MAFAPSMNPHFDIRMFKGCPAEWPSLADGYSVMQSGPREKQQPALVRPGYLTVYHEGFRDWLLDKGLYRPSPYSRVKVDGD
jgi:hypothetical protein